MKKTKKKGKKGCRYSIVTVRGDVRVEGDDGVFRAAAVEV